MRQHHGPLALQMPIDVVTGLQTATVAFIYSSGTQAFYLGLKNQSETLC